MPWPAPLVPPQGLDVTVPNVARIYDYLLGGKDNFAADREAARRLLAAVPDAARAAQANRAFLARAVRFLAAEAGIRQFLDIGTGLPTHGNVHEIAQAADPRARVVYCDNDPMVVVHANALLADNLTVAASQADLRDPDFLFTLPVTRDADRHQPAAGRPPGGGAAFPARQRRPMGAGRPDQAQARAGQLRRHLPRHRRRDPRRRGPRRRPRCTRAPRRRACRAAARRSPGSSPAWKWQSQGWWRCRRGGRRSRPGGPRPALFYAGVGRKPLPDRRAAPDVSKPAT